MTSHQATSSAGSVGRRRFRRASPAVAVAAALTLSGLVPLEAQAAPSYEADPASYVDPFIGTTGGGNTYPGAVLPFGMLSFSPDQNYYGGVSSGALDNQGYLRSSNPGGYSYSRTAVRGFSTTHISGPGCAGGSGDIPIFAMPGTLSQAPTVAERTAPVQATYSHANEEASAGYYRVGLDTGVNVELTATERTGSARFQFPAGADGTVLVRAAESMVGSTDAEVAIDSEKQTVSGSVTSGAFCGGYVGDGEVRRSYYTLHYVIEFDRPFKTVGTWKDTTLQPGSKSASGGNTVSYAEGYTDNNGSTQSGYGSAGKGAGGYLVFDTSANQTVNLRVGISYVSTANAKLNLDAENPASATFDATRAAAKDAWNKTLKGIEIAGGTTEERTAFYTALYHSLVAPSLGDDVNGEYRGFEGDPRVFKVGPGQDHQYQTFSLWDIYRGQTQLVAFLDPKRGSDLAYSLLNQAQQNRFNALGERPKPGDKDQGKDEWDRWTHVQGATHVMVGDPSAQTLAGILAYGGKDFPVETAYESLADAARNPTARDYSRRGWNIGVVGQRPSLDQSLRYGYYPMGCNAWGCLAETLEMAAADNGLASLAAALGKEDEAKEFAERANWWGNTFDSNAVDTAAGAGFQGWIRQRNADGSWASFNASNGSGLVEGTTAQYLWLVQHNLAGLIEALGGRETAERRLDRFFHNTDGTWNLVGSWSSNFNSNLDNEPDIHSPYIYNWTDAPWKAQATVRETVRLLWLDPLKNVAHGTNGIPGNDDLGTMSSWLVWSMLGMYPMDTSQAWMTLVAPMFTDVKINRAYGETITISAPGASLDNKYINSLKVNGAASDQRYLSDAVVAPGVNTTIDFTLATTPNTAWGKGTQNEPPSAREGEKAYTTTVSPVSTAVVAGATSGLVTYRAQRIYPKRTEALTYTVAPQHGITAVPASGRLTFGTDAVGTAALRFVADSKVKPGTYPVMISATTASGEKQKPVQVDVVVQDSAVGLSIAGSGFEAGDPPALDDVRLNASGFTGYSASDAGPVTVGATGTVAAGTTHGGTNALLYSARAVSDGATATNAVLDLGGIEVVPGMILSYWIKPLDNTLLSAGTVRDVSPHTTMDVAFTDGTTLSSLGTVAESGTSLEPNKWTQVSLTLPAAAAGKVLDKLLVQFGPTAAYVGSRPAPERIMAAEIRQATASHNFSTAESVTSITDGSSSTKWLASQLKGPWWAVYEFSTPQKVTSYVINSANDAEDRDPAAWVVEGSNDGQTWTTLDSRADQRFPVRRAEFDYTIPVENRGSYLYYRYKVTDRRGGNSETGGMMQIADWVLYRDAATSATNNGYSHGYIDDVVLTRPITAAILTSANVEVEAGALFSGTLGTITNTYAKAIDELSATIDWGDDTSPSPLTLTAVTGGGYSIAGKHRFAAPGTYAATVVLADSGIRQSLDLSITVTTPVKYYSPKLSVLNAKAEVARGTELRYLGTGFQPGEPVAVTVLGGVVEERADAEGRVSANALIPADAALGASTLKLEGAQSSKPVTASFTVVAPAKPVPPGKVKTSVALVVSGTKEVYGKAVELRATVSDAAASGTVEFRDGARTLKTVAIKAGKASFSTTSLAVGNRALTARYSGDSSRDAAVSATTTVVISKAAPRSVTVKAVKASKSSTARVTVTVGSLDNGRKAVGKVRITVDGKTYKTLKLSASGKVSLKVSAKAKKVQATFLPASPTTTASKASKTVKVKIS